MSVNFRRNLRKVIDSRSLTVNGAAQAWKVPQKTIDSIMKGERTPSLDTAEKIARAAGYELWQMLQADFDPKAAPRMEPMTPDEARAFRQFKLALLTGADGPEIAKRDPGAAPESARKKAAD